MVIKTVVSSLLPSTSCSFPLVEMPLFVFQWYFLHQHPMNHSCCHGCLVLGCLWSIPLWEHDSSNHLLPSCASAACMWEVIPDLPPSFTLSNHSLSLSFTCFIFPFIFHFLPEAHHTSLCFSNSPYWVERLLLSCEFLPHIVVENQCRDQGLQLSVSGWSLTKDLHKPLHLSTPPRPQDWLWGSHKSLQLPCLYCHFFMTKEHSYACQYIAFAQELCSSKVFFC